MERVLQVIKDILRKLSSNPLYQRYQIFLLPLFSAVICFGLFGLIVYPQINIFLENRKKIEEINIKQQLLESKLGTLEKVNPDIFKKNIEVALLALPAEKDVTGVISQLLYLLNINRLTLNEMSFLGVAAQDKQDSIQIKIDISGGKDSFKSFITGLASLPRIIKVSSLEVSSSKEGEVIQSSLTLQAFYQVLPNSIGNVNAPLPVISPKETEVLSKIQSSSQVLPQAPVASSSGSVVKGKTDPFK